MIPAGLGLQAPAVVGWSAVNYPDLSIRAVAVAMVVMIGNLGGIIASYLFPSTHAPHYRKYKIQKKKEVSNNPMESTRIW